MELDDAILRALTISTENKMVFPQSKNKWTNDTAVVDMLRPCRNEDDCTLICELFQQLNENIVDDARCYDLLCQMAIAIKKNETEGEHTALCVMRTKNDKDADGSQAIINELKMPLALTVDFKYGHSTVCFEEIHRLYNRGYRHFIVVDDFIGSGKTVEARYNHFLNLHLAGATMNFYFLAGMAKGISYCKNRNISVYCSQIMHKGISGHYQKEERLKRIWSMRYLESQLGSESGETKLKDNSWGYGHAEALYCRHFGNIPNSVFPLFWWNRYYDGAKRESVFTRVQDGY